MSASDEPDWLCIEVYHHTANEADLRGKRVLEVSCGPGGEASYLARTVCPTTTRDRT